MKLLFYLFVFLFISSSVYMTVTLNSIGIFLIYGFLGVILFYVIFYNVKTIRINRLLLTIFLLFTICNLVSSLINIDIRSALGSIALLVLYIATTVVFPSIVKNGRNEFLLKSIMFGHIPLLLIPLIIFGFTSIPYKGIFYNSNSLGGIATTLFTVLLSISIRPSTINKDSNGSLKKSRKKTIANYFFILLSFVLVIMSGSRTSFIATITVLSTALIFSSVSSIRSKRYITTFIKFTKDMFTALITMVAASFFIPIWDLLDRFIVSKFQAKLGNGDVLSGRGIVWEYTFNNAGLFGGGRDFYEQAGIEIGAHNTFISILGQYGWMSLLLLLLFLVVSFIYCLRYTILSNDNYKYFPILIFVCFLTLSMAEGMLFKMSMLATFCCIGTVSLRKTSLIKVNDPVRNQVTVFSGVLK